MPAAAKPLVSRPPQLTPRRLHRLLAEDGGKVEMYSEGGIRYLSGSFWTARQRQAHSIHEISYRACFKPQLPQRLMPLLTNAGECVLDPFMGRGTTVIQAALMQRQPMGSDINPLSRMLTEPRLNTPAPAAVAARLARLPAPVPVSAANEELAAFYHPQVLGELVALKHHFLARADSLDEVDKWIRMVAANRLAGHSSGFFSVKTMPPNQAVSVQTQRRLNAKSGLTPPPKNIAEIIMKKTNSLLRSGGVHCAGGYWLSCGEAHQLPDIADGTVSAVITSPPFLDVVDYCKDNWLRCWFTGIDPQEVNMQTHRSVPGWVGFVRCCFAEFARIVKKGGYVAFEVGEARAGRVLLEHAVMQAVAGLPFALVAVLLNVQSFTKTANCWGVANNRQGTNTNRIVLLRREG